MLLILLQEWRLDALSHFTILKNTVIHFQARTVFLRWCSVEPQCFMQWKSEFLEKIPLQKKYTVSIIIIIIIIIIINVT
jgi:hypothetical protein